MPIDPRIILGIQAPQFKVSDPLESAHKSLALQALMGQQELQGLQVDEAKRSADANRRLTELFGRNPNATPEEVMAIDPQRGMKMRQDAINNTKTQEEINKLRLESSAKRAESFRNSLSRVANQEDLDVLVRTNPIVAAEFKEQGITTPVYSPEFIRRNVLTADKFLDAVKPHITAVNDGQVTRFVDSNPWSNPNITQTTIQMQATPGEVMTDKRTREEGALNRGVTIRGQNMTDARQKDQNAIMAGRNTREDIDALRKEFDQLPEVKNYKAAYPAFAAVKDAASRDTLQSDINLIYGLAKLYDPTSVVREGEYATVANNQAIPEKLKGIMRSVGGGAKLTPETRAQIMREAEGRIAQYEDQYGKARGSFEGITNKRGYDASQVFPDTGRTVGGKVQAAPAQTEPGAMPAVPKAGEVRKGYRFKGGDPSSPQSWEKV